MALNFKDAVEEVEKASVEPSALVEYLRDHAPEIADLVLKDLTASDVHQTTALGNEGDKKKKPKSFKERISTMTDGPKPDAVNTEKSEFTTLKILKVEGDRQQMFGWASISTEDGDPIIDKQGDVIMPDDLEQAAYEFLLYKRQMGDMHERLGVGRVIESMVFTKEKQNLLGIDLGLEGWWIGMKVDDPKVWKRIKSGEQLEFSIGGRGERIEI
jgi:hypothetical protein